MGVEVFLGVTFLFFALIDACRCLMKTTLGAGGLIGKYFVELVMLVGDETYLAFLVGVVS